MLYLVPVVRSSPTMIRSSDYIAIDAGATGLKLLFSCGQDFFGDRTAFFHIVGMVHVHVSSESWNRGLQVGVHSAANVLRRRIEIPFGPMAFLVYNSLKTLATTLVMAPYVSTNQGYVETFPTFWSG